MFRVVLGTRELGRSPLEALDSGMAIATGTFLPSVGYSDVESLFRRLSDAIEARSVPPELYDARDALGLRLVGPDDFPIPTVAITVYDFGDALDRQLEVHLADVGAWKLARAGGEAG